MVPELLLGGVGRTAHRILEVEADHSVIRVSEKSSMTETERFCRSIEVENLLHVKERLF